jgi:BolA family transcriptional regulator, general stress-responsive regulator
LGFIAGFAFKIYFDFLQDCNLMTSIALIMQEKLKRAFDPAVLEVIDRSHLHVGHAGWREEGESHFHLKIKAAGFAGKSRLERQRMVNQVLREELAEKVHAMSMEIDGA